MKKFIYSIILLFTGIVNAQIVSIPDVNFKARLLAATPTVYIAKNLSGSFFKIDSNSDGEIQVSEAMQVSYLYLRQANISNMTGIENFQNITELICEMNTIGSLNTSSLTNLTILRCGNNNLTSLDVSALGNLVQLNCEYNQITGLNVSNLNNLVNFSCDHNQLTSLNVSNLTNLSQLSCNDNVLTSIVFTTNNNLTLLYCYNNQLTSLDFSILNSIAYVECWGNLFTSLSFQNLPNLTSLYCGNNQLTGVAMVNLPNLHVLGIGGSGITSLNLSAHTGLTNLTISGTSIPSIDLTNLVNLTNLDISDNPNIITLDLSSNPLLYNVRIHSDIALTQINLKNGTVQNIDGLFYDTSLLSLEYVCGDDSELAILQSEIAYFYQSYNVSVNTYCSFTPGGNYNTILGSVKFDSNNNGCDVSDAVQPNIKININNGTNQGATFTNNNGNYSFYTQAGSFDLTPNIENPSWFTFSPTTANVVFADNNNNTATQNFCVTANGVHPDLEIVISPVIPARPGFDAVYKIVYRNKGNQILSQQYGINFFYNQNLMDFVSTSVATSSIGTGSLSWDYANLQPFESRFILVTFNINAPTDSNPVNIADILTFTTSILPQSGDENTSDNLFVFNQMVVGSYDPNDVTCLEGDIVAPSEIGDYLHYMIRFENTGTAAAENIVVRTDINPADFDVNSLQLLNASHDVYTRVNGNVVEFIFENILLESGGHGNVLLKVKSLGSLQQGDNVNKRANIYFDYNYPVETNDYETIFQSLNNPDFETDNTISIYPNPSNGIVNVSGDFNLKSIQLFDMQGRLLQTNIVNENNTTIDITTQSVGVYFIRVVSDKGMKVEKLVKQ